MRKNTFFRRLLRRNARAGREDNNGQSAIFCENNSDFKTGNCPETENIKGARGGEFVADNKGHIQIHAVRMPGFVASQEVIFGSDGQVLKIHHDTINRECYMSGVALAIENVFKNNNFVYGLENII